MKIFDKVLNNIRDKDNEKKRLKMMLKEQQLEFAFLIFEWAEHGIPFKDMEELNIKDEYSYLMKHLKLNRNFIDDDSYDALERSINIRFLNNYREELQATIAKMSRKQKVLKSPSINEEYETSM